MTLLHRYPRTYHIEGSRLPSSDDAHDVLPFSALAGKHLVISEKIDGANAAISFSDEGRLLLQSRNRMLDPAHVENGPYAGIHAWAAEYEDDLWRVLGTRFVMFGEWVQMKQTVFYDALPAHFLELDVLDKEADPLPAVLASGATRGRTAASAGVFLSTPRRRALLRGLPIVSAPILGEGTFSSPHELSIFLGPSRFKTPAWREELLTSIAEADVPDPGRFIEETDPSDDMEGLYLKHEADGVVLERAKLVRSEQRAAMHLSGPWMLTRTIKNRIAG